MQRYILLTSTDVRHRTLLLTAFPKSVHTIHALACAVVHITAVNVLCKFYLQQTLACTCMLTCVASSAGSRRVEHIIQELQRLLLKWPLGAQNSDELMSIPDLN